MAALVAFMGEIGLYICKYGLLQQFCPHAVTAPDMREANAQYQAAVEDKKQSEDGKMSLNLIETAD